MIRTRGRIILAAAGSGLFLIVLSALRFWPGKAPEINTPREIIAHRGVHQTFSSKGVSDRTCTATRIRPVRHSYIENTIPSIKAAFESGATMVEVDIHHTRDGRIVVFHDWTLDCRTDGKGVTQDRLLSYLKRLDVGYGYTADRGRTFPLRGKGVGMMPTLEEVLDRFPGGRFVLHQKSASRRTVEILAKTLQRYPEARQSSLFYWGDRYADLKQLVPRMGPWMLSRKRMKSCYLRYLGGFGISSSLPGVCRDKVMILPLWASKYLWGWPNRFMQKVILSRSRLIIAWIDSMAEARRAALLPVHGVMTNRIELVGGWLGKQPGWRRVGR